MMNKVEELRVSFAMQVVSLGKANVSSNLYEAAERTLEEFLNPRPSDQCGSN